MISIAQYRLMRRFLRCGRNDTGSLSFLTRQSGYANIRKKQPVYVSSPVYPYIEKQMSDRKRKRQITNVQLKEGTL